MKTNIILDLCGGTGAWSKPYKDNGYDVRLITLPDYDVMTYKPPEGVYGILAAPVCTMFSLARTRAKTPRDFKQGMELVIACLNIIWECRYKNKLAFWCLENPMGYLRQFLGKPVFNFHPWEFGDLYSKNTDLWGYFNIPHKKPKPLEDYLSEEEVKKLKMNIRELPNFMSEYRCYCGLEFESKDEVVICPECGIVSDYNNKIKSISDFTRSKQSARRAITPQGFAKAFYKANQ